MHFTKNQYYPALVSKKIKLRQKQVDLRPGQSNLYKKSTKEDIIYFSCMKDVVLTCLFTLIGLCVSFAQVPELPRHMTDSEVAEMPSYLERVYERASQRTPMPSPHQPRAMAEWEELQGIVIAWSNSFWQIQAEIVRHAREEVVVYIATTNEDQVKQRLDIEGVDYTSNVEFIDAPYNSLWIRDYGPNTIYVNDVDSLVIVDWIYNRPRFQDDQIPQAVGAQLNIPVIELATQPYDLVHTGGNFMSNGNGQGFSSKLVLDENGPDNDWGMSNHSEEDIDNIMAAYMGISEYIKMTNLPYDLIHHIDMHMKMIDEETIIVGEYPEGIADGPQIEANIQYIIEQFKTTFNRDFNIIRIPMPPDATGRYPHQGGDYRTYANAMMINKTVLVPVYEEQYDTPALAIWQEALPGHKIVGINCNAIIPLSGALHCIIKELGTEDIIWVLHEPVRGSIPAYDSIPHITATIKHKYEIDNAYLFYSDDEGISFDSILMTYNDQLDVYEATFPMLGQNFYQYFIRVTTVNGKVIEKPQTGSLGGGWRFDAVVVSNQNTDRLGVEIGQIFPNPARGLTAIPISCSQKSNIAVHLYNSQGKLVNRLYDDVFEAHQKYLFFNANDYPAGTYNVVIDIGQNRFTRQVIIAE